MTPSDVIAVGALCLSAFALFVSVFISIMGFVFNYLTNRQNIKARCDNLITDKSIEAYREIVEKIIELQSKLTFDELQGEEKIIKFYQNLNEAYNECQRIFCKYRYYLPKKLAGDLYKNFLRAYYLT